jgi:hypothetical protein
MIIIDKDMNSLITAEAIVSTASTMSTHSTAVRRATRGSVLVKQLDIAAAHLPALVVVSGRTAARTPTVVTE